MATIMYSTIVSNTAVNTNNAFGVRNEYDPSEPQGLTMVGTVVANNTHTGGLANCGARNLISWPNYSYVFALTSGSHNLANDNSCNVSGFTIANPLLAPIANAASTNAADLENNGIEMAFNISPIRSRAFNWDSRTMFSDSFRKESSR